MTLSSSAVRGWIIGLFGGAVLAPPVAAGVIGFTITAAIAAALATFVLANIATGYFSRVYGNRFAAAHFVALTVVGGFLIVGTYMVATMDSPLVLFYAALIGVNLPLLGFVYGYFIGDLTQLDPKEARREGNKAKGGDDWGKV